MINYYDPNIRLSTHTVRVTLMQWDYIGHIAYEIGGNTRGAEVLEADFLEYIDEANDLVENDCKFTSYQEDGECYYRALLTKPDGGRLEVVEDEYGIKDMIVSLEIVKHEKEC